ncbi:ECF transporter S component [Brachybacterium sp. JHP9]|uniref:ECF transporter S component n=1 Tax=Brachybacterium equifaecis TaxID=2910770 RepID=A0ABT0R1M0_9MICO|nr:ECF transporter S component [Brachybacterium equifaecis]MCL6423817.1 ECF transporter S component [Brachybacterium equifaecis]
MSGAQEPTGSTASEKAATGAMSAAEGTGARGGVPARRGLAMKDIVLMVVLGVVFGFLYWVFVQAWTALAIAMGPLGDLSQHILFGTWLLVAPIALAIIRRPFVGIIAEILAAVVEVVFLGSPVGPLLLLAAFLQGLGCEIPFALGRYRRWGWMRFAVSGLLGATLVFFWTSLRLGWYGQDIWMLRLVIQALSGIVLGGLLAKVIVDALARTGVLVNFAIGADADPAAGTPRRER